MPVVINEFEVVAETPHGEAATPSGPEAPSAVPAASTPDDIERILRQLAERLARVAAP
jgi:hypothetical protein